jgi:hypothetical protein
MTNRQVYFYDPEHSTYYVTEYHGDRAEMEYFHSADTCDKTWPEILEDWRDVSSVLHFFQTSSAVAAYYHPQHRQLPGVRVHILHSVNELKTQDETYGITMGRPGIYLDAAHSAYAS